nr:immunoglobulin light chain junction region [Macaca mulatta]
CQHFHTYPQTF